MFEWSEPTVVSLAKIIEHCQKEYKEVFGRLFSPSSPSHSSVAAVFVEKEGWREVFFPMDLQFQLRDVNVFVYGLQPGKCVRCLVGVGP